MYLLWLRVAADPLRGSEFRRLPGCALRLGALAQELRPSGRSGVLLPLCLVVEMLVQAHRWMPVGVREMESLLGFAIAGAVLLVWWLYDAISLGIFVLPVTFFLVFVPALGPDRYTFPSEGVRIGWLVAHIVALLVAYVALGFSLLASMLYLIQERRIKNKLKARRGLLVGSIRLAAAAGHAGAHCPRNLEFGFPCMTVGLVIGSVLAQETSLGAAYFLDPKVIASFVCGLFTLRCSLFAAAPGSAGARRHIFPARSFW